MKQRIAVFSILSSLAMFLIQCGSSFHPLAQSSGTPGARGRQDDLQRSLLELQLQVFLARQQL